MTPVARTVPALRKPSPNPLEPARIRAAELADASGIVSIYNAAVATTTATFDTRPRTVAAQRRLLQDHGPRFPVLVAETAGLLVGWSSLSPWSDRPAYSRTGETSVYVQPAAQGRGVGGLLLDALIARSRELGFHTILARIAEPNPASAGLHRSRGFLPVGTMREVGYKFGHFIDVTLWQLEFGPGAGG